MNFFSNIWPDWFLYSEDQPMFFTSILFWVFFTVFLGVYSMLYSREKVRNAYLLFISLFLYYKINGFYLLLLLFVCLINYLAGLLSEKTKRRKLLLWTIVSVDLLFLGFYKYMLFLTESLNSLLTTNFKVINWFTVLQNTVTGDGADIYTILLPAGISFYTFQAISYQVDLYRRQMIPVKRFVDFSFYLSFFPHLVAGPIIRASYFIPQLYQKYKLSKSEFSHAIFLILKGSAKKMIIADFLAINFIDRVFDAPMTHSGVENLLALYAYAIQIYCDFSGYTDIAIGLALILGFKIPVNFNAPYQSTSLTDFWHRWHISLSLWLRDYLYIPLGGNRKGKVRTYLNLMVTMLLGGLWHGASLQFVIWGGIHGVGLAIEKLVARIQWLSRLLAKVPHWLAVFLTFQVVSLAWLFFRLDSFDKIKAFAYQIWNHFSVIDSSFDQWMAYRKVWLVFVLGLILIWTPYRVKEKIRGKFISSPYAIQIAVAVLIISVIAVVSQSALQPFIYFRF